MAASLIRGRHIICRASGRDQAQVVDDGAVFQRDGLIVEVGRYADLAARYRPDETIGSGEHVVLPGFVNAHHHVGLTPFQLGSPDYPLEVWLASRLAARDVDPYLDTLYSGFELLESGVTTVHHLTSFRRGPRSAWPDLANRILEAYRDLGLRVCFSSSFRDQNRLVYGSDDDFVGQLPASIAGDVAELLAGQAIPLEAFLDELFVGLWEAWGRNAAERTRIQVAPANLQWCSDRALTTLKETAQRYGVGLHIHLLETAYQREYAHRRSGLSAVQHLANLGFLGPDVTLGHGVWLNEADLELVGQHGVMVCHNASSNLRLQSGVAPLNELLARGSVVGMGIDEAGLNDDRDMLQEMRLTLKLHRVPGIDAPVPTAAQVFRMATEHGARTTHYASEIGLLEPGRAADLVLLLWDQLAHPYLDWDIPPLDALLQRGRSPVDLVMIAGEVVLRDGRSTRLKKDEVLTEIATALGAPLRPDELRRREVARDLLPYAKRFYDGWLRPDEWEPYYSPSSRR